MNPFTALKNLSQCCEDRYDPGSWKMDQRCSTNYVLLPSFNCPETESNNLWFSISAQLFTLRERCIQRMFCVAVRWLAVSRRGPLQLLETYWVQSMTFGRGRSGGLQARNFVMKGPVRRSSSIGPVSVCVIHNVGCFLVVMWKHMLPHHHDWLLRILNSVIFLKFGEFNEAPTNSLMMIY